MRRIFLGVILGICLLGGLLSLGLAHGIVPGIVPGLSSLRSAPILRQADLEHADLSQVDLSPVELSQVDLGQGATRDVYYALRYDRVRVRTGPSFAAGIDFTYQRQFLPVKSIDAEGNWILVLDWQDFQGWINRSQLITAPYLVVKVTEIVLYARPDLESPKRAVMTEGVVVKPEVCDQQWCKVTVVQAQEFVGHVQRQALWGSFPSDP